MHRFTFYDYFLAFLSTATYVADVATDVALIVYFFTEGHPVWGSLTVSFVVLAALVMQVFSFHWHVGDRTLTWGSLFIHLLFLAPLHRYLRVFHLGRRSRRTGSTEDLSAAYREINDISILRLVETFLESAPQLVLQMYIVLSNLQNFNTLLGFSMVFSLLSVSWSVTAYTDALHLAYKKFYKRSFVSMVTHVIWQTGMITARVVPIVLFATVFHGFVGIPLGIHFVIMLVWITKIQPEFGSTTCERRLFTVVSAAIHTFCFLNLKDGNSRYRMAFYYVLMLIETAVYMTVWYMNKPYIGPIWFDVTAFSVVFGAFGLGTLFLLLYYGCCHPSGPAPIPSQKPEFLKPGNIAFGQGPKLYKQPNLQPKKPQHNQQMMRQSKGNPPSIFDVTSTSTRINLWLSASLDLSKEGLAEDPDSHLDPSLQLPSNLSRDNTYRMEEYSQQRNVSLRTDVNVSPLGSSASNSADKPLLGRSHYSSYLDQGSYRDTSRSEVNRTDDRLDFSKVSRITEREHSIPDYNLVEMFARCKLDPSFVSNSSISDILFNQTMKQDTPTGRHGKCSLSPENPSGRTLLEQNRSESDISSSNWNHTKTSDNSSKSLIYSAKSTPDREMSTDQGPMKISPLDPSRLWEESKNRLRLTPSYHTGSDPAFNQQEERSSILTVTPDTSRGITHLSLSYSDSNSDNTVPKVNGSGNRENSAFSEAANSFVFRNGVDKSIESLSNSSNLLSQSELLSFSDVSLQLPDGSSNSRNNSDTQPDIVQCTSAKDRSNSRGKNKSGEKYMKRSTLDKKDKSRSVDSFSSREYSPSDRQSYLSDRGIASSDRGLSSSHSTNDASVHRSLTSSGFQSEDSNMSATSPAYSHFCSKNANQFESTPVVENEISSIYPPSSTRPVSTKRVSLDEDLYPDVSKFKNSTPVIEENTTPVLQHALQDNITPITSSECKKPHSMMPPSSLFYSEKRDVGSPVLPPLGWSRCSSSAGSSSSGGRFFKDPTIDDCGSQNGNKSDEDSKCQSMVSQGSSSNVFLEKSSLSALLSDMSSSKCTRMSEETLSLASDPDSLRRSSRSVLSASMMRKAESLPYMPEHGSGNLDNLQSGITASLPYQPYHRRSLDRSQNSIHEYENINNYSSQNTTGSNSSSLNLSGGKTVSSYLCSNEPEKQRLQELYNEFSQVSSLKNESCSKISEVRVPDYENVNQNTECNTIENEVFSRDKWRASLDKEMKVRLVHDIENLAPKKLYQLRAKNGPPRKKLSPVDISEYTESPYKFRKANNPSYCDYENVDSLGKTTLSEYTESPYKVRKAGSAARRTVFDQNVKCDRDSLTGEYENINSLSSTANYENINHLLGPCPVATPESLSDAVFLDDFVDPLQRGDKTYNLINYANEELQQESCNSESLRSLELLRNKSPINTSGLNSAFKPVKGRRSDESDFSKSSGDSEGTYSVNNEISYKNSEFVHSGETSLVENTSVSLRSGKNSRRQSNVSAYLSDAESMSSFQWSQNSGSLSLTGMTDSARQSPRNYLQLAGKHPLNFSVPTFLKDDSSSQTSKHSYTDSIPWDETENSLQTTADLSGVKPTPRQPLKALENTPVFSPIYGQDRRIDIELTSRKRFMSTPKLCTGSEINVSRNSEDSMALSGIKTPQRRRSSGISKRTYSDNTSTWSSQSEADVSLQANEHSTFALSKTTYI